MLTSWPPSSIANPLGTATLSLGNAIHHKLEPRLREAAKAGFKQIDLFDECWAAYLEEHGLPGDQLWEPTLDNLRVAKKLGDLVKSLGMRISCTQPLRTIEGIKDPLERRAALDLVAKRFPFMRAFDTDLVFMCANIRTDDGVTSDLRTVARDLAELGDMAQAFSDADSGPLLKIGYEGLSWAQRNTWASTWEAVRMANRPNVGLIIDAFNVLAVEWADPYNPAGHGRIYPTIEESVDVLCASLAGLVASVPGDRIFFFQVGDAELMDPTTFLPPSDPQIPPLLPWSRGHRLYPYESSRGGYMPTHLVAAAVLATGYKGPISLEVFNKSLNVPGDHVPVTHAERGITGLRKLAEATKDMPAFWEMYKKGTISGFAQLLQLSRSGKL
ncbi:sugar phosphate isomerase/epimerase family protein [Aspergillus clavatus NRRL 1]|uniref:AP endonuclease, family 2, putative n=1 Tax=Aspergillus clavatus (strain ATCC 1007 / CBS 513.65 / DSM 816 / NCTC 3887 / NRRL 1 / QM 1276 / 107) TaxID=344612 RepID=A1CFN5_ASPCL|nr:AP endonuclease, family 2, putative [Aspergillus clavatus NRRL 1]EAW11684.1 AP endonuclease, family 2, putative [Aspergillus clavatus NRRL 1]